MSSRKHGSKQIQKFIKEIEHLGFTVINTKNKYRIYPPRNLNNRIYITHGGLKSIKPLCADFKKIYGVELNPKNFL